MNRSHTADSYLRAARPLPRRPPRHRAQRRFHRRLPRRDRSRVRRDAALVDAVGYAQAFSFKYSPRPGTPAATMDGPGRRARSWTSGSSASRPRSTATSSRSTRPGRQALHGAGRAQGQEARPVARQVAVAAIGVLRGQAAIGDLVEVELAEAGPNSLARPPAGNRSRPETRQSGDFPPPREGAPLALPRAEAYLPTRNRERSAWPAKHPAPRQFRR